MLVLIIFLDLLFLFGSFADIQNADVGSSEQTEKEPAEKAQRLRVEGQVAFENRDYAKAIKFYNKLIKIDKSHTSYHSRAMVHLAVNNFPKAYKDLAKAIEKGPKETQSYYYRGKTKKKFGLCVEALADFRHVLQIDSQHRLALDNVRQSDQCIDLMHRVKPFEDRGDCHGAESYLEQLLEITPYNKEHNLFYATCKIGQEDYQGSLKFAGNVLRGDDKDLDALLVRGKAYYYMEDIDRAMQHWKKGLSLDPEHKALKKLFKGVRKFQKKFQKAEELKAERKYVEAVEQLDMALEFELSRGIKTKVLHDRCNIGLHRRFDKKKRVELCKEAKQFDPEPASSSGDLGKAYTMAEDWDKAKIAYSEANRKDPHNHEYGDGLRNAEHEVKKSEEEGLLQDFGCTKLCIRKTDQEGIQEMRCSEPSR